MNVSSRATLNLAGFKLINPAGQTATWTYPAANYGTAVDLSGGAAVVNAGELDLDSASLYSADGTGGLSNTAASAARGRAGASWACRR
jgi:hypothetical protein